MRPPGYAGQFGAMPPRETDMSRSGKKLEDRVLVTMRRTPVQKGATVHTHTLGGDSKASLFRLDPRGVEDGCIFCCMRPDSKALAPANDGCQDRPPVSLTPRTVRPSSRSRPVNATGCCTSSSAWLALRPILKSPMTPFGSPPALPGHPDAVDVLHSCRRGNIGHWQTSHHLRTPAGPQA
jgi:hypothetical protein